VALLCGAWAGAETLDEAVARLTKAAAGTRDVTIKYTIKGVERMTTKSTPFSGTLEFQMLRDGGKTLLRFAATLTGEVPAKEEGGPPQKIERKLLSVNDGQFVWTERARGKSGILIAYKDVPRDREGLGLEHLSGPIEGAYAASGLKGHLNFFQRNYGITVGAKGAVAGRPTTVFNLLRKQAEEEKAPDPSAGGPPAKMVVELDDATGATAIAKWFNAAGEVVWDIAATEVKANAGLDKKLFAYAPPDGMQVIDRTKPPEPEKKEQ
jgi:outer membrane lipoprotein-sorting protein